MKNYCPFCPRKNVNDQNHKKTGGIFMATEVLIRERKSVKHGKIYEYRFETASIDGKLFKQKCRAWRRLMNITTAAK